MPKPPSYFPMLQVYKKMAQGHKFQDLEETGEALVAFINSSQPEKLRQVKKEHQAFFESHMETKTFITHILKGKL